MFELRGFRLAAVGLSVVLTVGIPAQARAQGLFAKSPAPAQAPATQDTVDAGPQAIPWSEIPLQTDEALARLHNIRTQMAADPDLALIEAELPDELEALSREHDRLSRIVLEHLSIRELWNLNAIWRSHEEKLASWASAFEDELQQIARVAEVGGNVRDAWRLTAESLADEDEPPQELVEQTERVLGAVDSLAVVVRARLGYLLGVKSQLDGALEGVRHVLTDVEAARASVRGRMFTRNSVPLWRVSSIREQSRSQMTARIWSEDLDAVSAFAGSNSGWLLAGVLLFLVLALLGVRVRERIASDLDPSDESLRAAAETLRHPVSAALLLSILLAQPFLRSAPFIVLQVLTLMAVVPLYRLLPQSRNRVINRTMRWLLVLVAAVATADLLVPAAVESRLVTLVVAVAVSAVAGWILRSADPAQMRQTGWGVVVWRGLQLTFAAGFVCFVANVFGWALFAETLLTGVLYSAYLGLGLVIGYRVAAGLVRLLPRTQLGQASHIIREYGDPVTSRSITILKWVAIVAWVFFSLEVFEIADPIGDWLMGILTGSIQIGSITFSLEKIIAFALVVLVSIYVARLVRFVLDVELLPRLKLKRGVSNAISTVVQWAILGAGLLTAASTLGLEAGQLAIVFGALSVGIGFGLQNIVSNFVSGLILIFEQPVKVGDKVEITSLKLTGEVQRIGIRASVVRTFDGAEVIVPNSNLISSEVINWTLSDQRRRVRVEVGVAYGSDPHQVVEILKATAAAHREVLRYPEPFVVFREFGDSSLNFWLLFWTATFEDFFRVRSEMNVAVHDALKEAGITIPFPQRDLHVRTLPGAETELVPGSLHEGEGSALSSDQQP
jgi:small-conductance mechanosensitive channel